MLKIFFKLPLQFGIKTLTTSNYKFYDFWYKVKH